MSESVCVRQALVTRYENNIEKSSVLHFGHTYTNVYVYAWYESLITCWNVYIDTYMKYTVRRTEHHTMASHKMCFIFKSFHYYNPCSLKVFEIRIHEYCVCMCVTSNILFEWIFFSIRLFIFIRIGWCCCVATVTVSIFQYFHYDKLLLLCASSSFRLFSEMNWWCVVIV